MGHSPCLEKSYPDFCQVNVGCYQGWEVQTSIIILQIHFQWIPLVSTLLLIRLLLRLALHVVAATSAVTKFQSQHG